MPFFQSDSGLNFGLSLQKQESDSGLNFGLSLQKQTYSDLNLTQESS